MVSGTPKPGSQTVGRYVVYGEIASGGMATVHFGRLTGLAGFARPVAVKKLHAHYARDPEFVKMFLDEARLAARITHPNVVPTLDVVQAESDLFLVMDYVQGAALSHLARAAKRVGERIPPAIAAGIMAGTLHGLHAAHEARDESGERLYIVHRDVSPQNVLVGTDGVARVLDFGVAKAAGRMQETRDGQLKGKLSYMAPEQIRGDAVTRRTDVYAAAVVLWELLTGERLFWGENDANIMSQVLEGNVPAPSTFVHDLPSALDPIVLRGLHREPGSRYGTARDMAQEIEATVSVASSAAIGDWVERIAGAQLQERAKRVSEIERTAAEEEDSGSSGRSSATFVHARWAWPTAEMPTPSGGASPQDPSARSNPSVPSGPSVQSSPSAQSNSNMPSGPPPASTHDGIPSQVSGVAVTHPTSPPSGSSDRGSGLRLAVLTYFISGGATALVLLVATVIGVTRSTSPSRGASAAAGTATTIEMQSEAPPPLDEGPATTPPEALSEPADTLSVDTSPSAAPALSSAPEKTAPATTGPSARFPFGHPPTHPADCNPPYTTDGNGHVHFKPQCI